MTWTYDSLRRLVYSYKHRDDFVVSGILGVFGDEDRALEAEKQITEQIGAVTGLLTRNHLPYTTGHKSRGGAKYFAIYFQAG